MDQNFAWLFLEAAIFFSICFHNFVLMKRLKIWNNAHNTPFSLWKAWICLLYKWWLIHDPNKVLNISYKQWQWLKERKSFNQSSFLSFFFLSVCVTSQNCFFCPNSYRVEGYQALPTWSRQFSGAEQILHVFLSLWAVLLWLPDTKLGLCFWLRVRSTILQGPIFPIENLLMMTTSFWEGQKIR